MNEIITIPTAKKAEKGHGNWIPFLKDIAVPHHTAKRLINAFKNQDKYIDGMTFTELTEGANSTKSTISVSEREKINNCIKNFRIATMTGKEMQLVKMIIAPSIQTEGKVYQMAQRVGMKK